MLSCAFCIIIQVGSFRLHAMKFCILQGGQKAGGGIVQHPYMYIYIYIYMCIYIYIYICDTQRIRTSPRILKPVRRSENRRPPRRPLPPGGRRSRPRLRRLALALAEPRARGVHPVPGPPPAKQKAAVVLASSLVFRFNVEAKNNNVSMRLLRRFNLIIFCSSRTRTLPPVKDESLQR